MQDRPSYRAAFNPKDQLQQRVEELVQLINRNNHQFNKGTPSQVQLSSLLDHTSDCYDQLAFIENQQAAEEMPGTLNKQLHKQMGSIFSSSKIFFKNVNSWIGGFEVELLKKLQNQQVYENQLAGFKNSCKICHSHVEEIVLREAKKDIIGPMNWRQLFDEELMNQKEDLAEAYETPEQKDYVGSVNFLTKVIREMQESVQGYENLASRIEKDNIHRTEERTMKLLEELVSKVKSKMGERCLPKMQEILQKELLRTTAIKTPPPRYEISEQLSYCLGNPLKKALMNRSSPASEVVIEKLKQENKRLTIEKNAVTELYQAAQIYLSTADQQLPQIHQKPKQLSNFARTNEKKETVKTQQRRTLPQNHGPLNTLTTQQNQTENNRTSMNTQSQVHTVFYEKIQRIAMIPSQMKSKKGSMLVKRMSTLASQIPNFRQSELGSIFGRSLQEEQPQLKENEDMNRSSSEQEEQVVQKEELTKEVGCQWDLNDLSWNSSAKSSSKQQLGISLEEIPQNARPSSNKNTLKFGSPPKSSNASIRSKKRMSSKDKDEIIQSEARKTSKENHKPSIFKETAKNTKEQSKDDKKKNNFLNKKHLGRQYGFNRSKPLRNQELHSQTASNHAFPHELTGSFSHTNLGNLSIPNFDINEFQNLDSEQHNPLENMGLRKSTLGQLRLKLERYNVTEQENQSYRNGMLKGASLEQIKAERNTAGSLGRSGIKQSEITKKLQPIIQHESILDSNQYIVSQAQIKDPSLSIKNKIFNPTEGIPNSLRKDNKKLKHLSNRNATEGNERKSAPKNKCIRNFLFQAQHLFLFGGLSESYNYQQLPLPKSDEDLSEQDKTFLQRVLAYLSNLKGFKRNIYQNIVLFLKSPWEVIDKNECEFIPVTNQMLYKLVTKLLSYHKKKCSGIPCEHLRAFAEIIGFAL